VALTLKSCSSSEVAAMIEGLLRHCTDANIEANYTDTHGACSTGSPQSMVPMSSLLRTCSELATIGWQRMTSRAAFCLHQALDCTPPGAMRLSRLMAVEAMLVAGSAVAASQYEGEVAQAPAGPWRDYGYGRWSRWPATRST
jgi:hypothetical protein